MNRRGASLPRSRTFPICAAPRRPSCGRQACFDCATHYQPAFGGNGRSTLAANRVRPRSQMRPNKLHCPRKDVSRPLMIVAAIEPMLPVGWFTSPDQPVQSVAQIDSHNLANRTFRRVLPFIRIVHMIARSYRKVLQSVRVIKRLAVQGNV